VVAHAREPHRAVRTRHGRCPGHISGRRAAQYPAFKRVNSCPAIKKNALRGTQHAIREQHAPRYLAEIEYRFNHRFDLPAMIERLTRVALRTPPMPYRLLKMAENFG